jgi:hypothetical protein
MSVVWQLNRTLETAGMGDIETATVKATFSDDFFPKEKHVADLVGHTRAGRSSEVVQYLRRRLRTNSWKTALKTLNVIHRVLREGSPAAAEHFSREPGKLAMRGFSDDSDPTAWGHCKFIGFYSEYLICKLETFSRLEFAPERRIQDQGAEWLKKIAAPDLFAHAEFVSRQFNALLACEVFVERVDVHPVAKSAMIQLLKDSFHIYSYCSMVIVIILDQFQHWNKTLRGEALEFYRNFVVQNSKFKDWAVRSCKLEIIDYDVLPDFDSVPTKIVHTLEAFHKEASGEEPLDSEKASKKKTKKKTKKESRDDEEEEIEMKRKGSGKASSRVFDSPSPDSVSADRALLTFSPGESMSFVDAVPKKGKTKKKSEASESESVESEEKSEEEVKAKKKGTKGSKKKVKKTPSKKREVDEFEEFFKSGAEPAPSSQPVEAPAASDDLLDLFSTAPVATGAAVPTMAPIWSAAAYPAQPALGYNPYGVAPSSAFPGSIGMPSTTIAPTSSQKPKSDDPFDFFS